jgi:hypothetical protein
LAGRVGRSDRTWFFCRYKVTSSLGCLGPNFGHEAGDGCVEAEAGCAWMKWSEEAWSWKAAFVFVGGWCKSGRVVIDCWLGEDGRGCRESRGSEDGCLRVFEHVVFFFWKKREGRRLSRRPPSVNKAR